MRIDFRSRRKASVLTSTIVQFVVYFLLADLVAAFVSVTPLQSQYRIEEASIPVTTELNGIRSAIRNRYQRFRESRRQRRQQKNENNSELGEDSINGINGEAVTETVPVVAVDEKEGDINGDDDECLLDESTTSILPPRDEMKMTRYEKEFRQMMKEVESYTDRCVRSVADPKSRAIFAGARAGAAAPEVYRAFEILFQDLVPVRIAGRMIFKKLSQVMNDSRDNHQQQIDLVASATGMNPNDVESGRFAFLSISDYKDDGDTVLNLDQLVETGVATTVVEMLGYNDFDDFVRNTCNDARCELKFDETMVALQRCPAGSTKAECNPHLVLQEIAARMNSTDATAPSDRKEKYSKRYDKMVESFSEWEQFMPEGDSRWLEVLRGCFVGAKIDEVVKALKIVYIDYSALRLAGDSIYNICGSLIVGKKNKSKIPR